MAVARSIACGHPGAGDGAAGSEGNDPGDQLFVDDVRLTASGPPGTWELTPGSHRLRLMAGNQELIAGARVRSRQMQRSSSTVLTSSSPLQRRQKDHLPGTGINDPGDPAAVEGFRSAVIQIPPSGRRRSPELEGLRIGEGQDNSDHLRGVSGVIRARYTSPPGPHLPSALAEISRLEWEGGPNTTDPLQVKKFLEQNPSGQYHDRGVALLDDLGVGVRRCVRGMLPISRPTWAGYPSGRRREEATAQLARLDSPAGDGAGAGAGGPTPAPIPSCSSGDTEGRR